MSPRRPATHANSWYVGDRQKLNNQLNTWIGDVSPENCGCRELPVPSARVIMAPHAGYSYSGPTAGFAYKAWDLSRANRIFILGPAHHIYTNRCSVSQCSTYDTPLGELELDTKTLRELIGTGRFAELSITDDGDEHSIEMHLPYVYKAIELAGKSHKDVKIVPIVVGSISTAQEKDYGSFLMPYLMDPQNAFVVSTDFCHWGSRFSYTGYFRELPTHDSPDPELIQLRDHGYRGVKHPIHTSIKALDHQGMAAIGTGKHGEFASYLSRTKNTICGRHPIGVFMAAVEAMLGDTGGNSWGKFKYLHYAQSEEIEDVSGSSVSYVSGFMELP